MDELKLVNSGDRLLNMDEACSLLGIRKATLYDMTMEKTDNLRKDRQAKPLSHVRYTGFYQ